MQQHHVTTAVLYRSLQCLQLFVLRNTVSLSDLLCANSGLYREHLEAPQIHRYRPLMAALSSYKHRQTTPRKTTYIFPHSNDILVCGAVLVQQRQPYLRTRDLT